MIKNYEHCKNRWDNKLCNDLECGECDNYEEEEYISKYRGKRFYLIVDGWHEEILLEDRLNVMDTGDYSNAEEGLTCAMRHADFLNDLNQESEDTKDIFTSAILELLEKYFRLKHNAESIYSQEKLGEVVKVLEELLHETGEDDLIVDFYDRMSEEIQNDELSK